ncbi:MAG: hypothetical protein LBO63_07100 [Oscillospiraceae bacterium]|jgi:hypothetical protein|nr:hypothetical protein [Oscillospiraceae bacterium]
MKKAKKMIVALLATITLVSALGVSASASFYWKDSDMITGSSSGYPQVQGQVGIYGEFVGSGGTGVSVISLVHYYDFSTGGYVFTATGTMSHPAIGDQYNWSIRGKNSAGTTVYTKSLSQRF